MYTKKFYPQSLENIYSFIQVFYFYEQLYVYRTVALLCSYPEDCGSDHEKEVPKGGGSLLKTGTTDRAPKRTRPKSYL